LDEVYKTGRAYFGRAAPVLFNHPDGTPGQIRYVDFIYQPMVDEHGGVAGIFVEGHDTTDAKVARMSLEESEGRFRLFSEVSRDGVAIEDGETVLDCNLALARMLGFDAPEEVIGRPAASFATSESLAKVPEQVRTASDEPYEVVGLRRDGSTFPLEVVRRETTWKGQKAGVAVVRDLTDRRQREAALRESEAHLAAIFDQAAAGIAETDLSGRFLRVNDGFCHIVGRSREELLQTRMQQITHPEDLTGNLRLFKRMIEAGEPFQIQKRYLHPNGTDVWVNNSVTRVIGANGQASVVAVTVDITEQKRAEETNARLAAIVASTSDAVISFAPDTGRIQTWNSGAERLFGYTEEEAVGGPVSLLVPPPEGRTSVENQTGVFDRAMAEGHVLVETTRRRKDGSRVHVSVSATRMTDAAGRVLGVSAIFRDITEQKRWEEHQRLLVNELNHRVKNTLATVQSIASQTMRNAATAAEAKTAIEGRLFALSRAHDVLTRENWESADLYDIAQQALAPYASQGEDRLHVAGPRLRLPPRFALAIAMGLQELSTNAVKYGALSNATGKVRVLWDVDTSASPFQLKLSWTESGGPPVQEPRQRGFGTRLITRSLGDDLDGKVTLDFRPEGLVCTVEAPVPGPAPE
jgi:PAS domain S-box-containing protein